MRMLALHFSVCLICISVLTACNFTGSPTPLVTATNASPAKAGAVPNINHWKLHVVNSVGNNSTSYLIHPRTTQPIGPTISGLSNPQGMAINSGGIIYVANAGNNSVTSYLSNGSPTAPTITAGINHPEGVAVDSQGKIYVANANANDVTTYTSSGIRTTPTITIGISRPWGIAIDSTGKIYVANAGANDVTSYNPDGTQTVPTLTDGINVPQGITVGGLGSGRIIVADSGSNSVTTYSLTGTRGSTTIEGLSVPTGVAVAPSGIIFISNLRGNNVSTFDNRGRPFPRLTITQGIAGPAGLVLRPYGR